MFKHSHMTPIYSQKQNGFTLIELMLTLAIASLVMTMAVPSFSTMMKNNRLTNQINQLVTALNLARSEAVNRRVNVDVVAVDDSSSANEWGKGWNVVINGGDTLRVFPALDGGMTLDSVGSVNTIQYSSAGRASVMDVFTLCDDRTGETGREVTISVTGRISVAGVVCS